MLVVLFAILQVAAPLWHVCEMGGHHARHQDAPKLKEWKPKCGGGTLCPCKPPPGAIYSPSGQFIDERPAAFKGTCLARALMGLPGLAGSPLSLAIPARPRAVLFTAPFLLPDSTSLSLPPARAPPAFSL